jgi:5-(carboxyamino)imidazole ribonucleotide mutase
MSVAIIMGSKSDMEVAEKAKKILDELKVDYTLSIASAHRTPEFVEELVSKSQAEVFIAIAGLSAALPGVIAAHTTKPVIGVPVSGKVNLDSILSIVQMPPGIPVAAVGLDRGDNAALLAAEIIALNNPSLQKVLWGYRENLKNKVIEDNDNIE